MKCFDVGLYNIKLYMFDLVGRVSVRIMILVGESCRVFFVVLRNEVG